MEIEAIIDTKIELHSLMLDFIESNEYCDDYFQALMEFIDKKNISKNKLDLQDLLQLILMISNEHQRNTNFFDKFLQIISFIQPNIQSFFTNLEVYNIFKTNILLTFYLVQRKIIILDKEVLHNIKYFHYNRTTNNTSNIRLEPFNPFQHFYYYIYYKDSGNDRLMQMVVRQINQVLGMDMDTLQKVCQKGENESYICSLIREDSLNDFIAFVNQKSINLNSEVKRSIFETNNFLINKQTKLIEYAAFYGSIQIFKYLLMNKVNINPIIMDYAVHSLNSEIIHLIEENLEKFKQNKYFKTKIIYDPINPLIESIKCHHNDFFNYFYQNYFDNNSDNLMQVFQASLACYNYNLLPSKYSDFLRLKNKYKRKPIDIYDVFINLTKITIPSTTTIIFDSLLSDFNFLKEIVLPNSITLIEKNAFENCSSLEKVTIPSSVTKICEYAFKFCLHLAEIDLPSSLVVIEDGVFSGCLSLKQIKIPSSVTCIGIYDKSEFEEISIGVFYGCSSLHEIVIPSSVTKINSCCFSECRSLEKIVFENFSDKNELIIGVQAFFNCKLLKQIEIPPCVTLLSKAIFENCSFEKIEIPSSVTMIDEFAFNECNSLKQIKIPSSVTIIEDCAFNNCNSLQEMKIPSSVTKIGKYVFCDCSSLSKIVLPSSITEINEHCFRKCSSLKQVVIPSSVTHIGVGSFEGCSSLEIIEIPSSVNEIEGYAFDGCSSLKQITFNSNITVINIGMFKECTSLIEFVIPSSVKEIHGYAFQGCKLLKELKIPSCIPMIEDNCFEGCSSLQQITIPDSVTIIEGGAFKDCTSLTKIKIPSSVKSMKKCAFKGCTSLEEINIPSSLSSIEKFCFEDCISLKEITIPSSIKLIKKSAFKNCSLISKIEIPSSVKRIYMSCFEGCSSLKEVKLPSSLISIDEYIFKGCTSITKFIIPSTIKVIKYGAFEDCTSLTEIEVPSTVTEIQDSVFNGCKSLIKFSIPSSITVISDYLFCNCTSLKEVELPPSITEIRYFAFYGCSSLSKLTIPSSLTQIGMFAFSGCTLLPQSTFPIEVSTKENDLKLINTENNNNNQIESIQDCIQNEKEIYQKVFSYLESNDDKDEDLIELIRFLREKDIPQNLYKLIELLNLISKISKNHCPTTYLFTKSVKIVLVYKDEIRQKVKIKNISSIFGNNKRFYLAIFENEIIKRNRKIAFNLIDEKFTLNYQYFQPELIKYVYEETLKRRLSKLPPDFKKKRRLGVNDSEICRIIREDSIDEFIDSFKQMYDKCRDETGFRRLNMAIPETSYESNKLLTKISFFEYAAYYNAFKIFSFLLKTVRNGYRDKYYNCLLYAIYGNSMDIIQLLEKVGIKPIEKPSEYNENNLFTPLNCFNKAIRCHHHKIAEYIFSHYKFTSNYINALKYYNFAFFGNFYSQFADGSNDGSLLFYLCLYDYPHLAKVLIDNKKIDVNQYNDQIDIKFMAEDNDKGMSIKDEILQASVTRNNLIIHYIIEHNKTKIDIDSRLLFEVIDQNDKNFLKILLNRSSIDVNVVLFYEIKVGDSFLEQTSLLFSAISSLESEFVRLLLRHPLIDVNLSFPPYPNSRSNFSALNFAILIENIQDVKMLLNHSDIDVNSIAHFDEKSYRFSNWLNNRNIKFEQYFTPLHEAIELGNNKIIKLILNHPNVSVNKIEIIDTFLTENKVNFKRVKQTVLCRAIQMNNIKLVKYLLSKTDIDVNKPAVMIPRCNDDLYDEDTESDLNGIQFIRKTPLEFAIATKNKDMVNLLLNRSDIIKIDVDAKEKEMRENNEDIISDFTDGINIGFTHFVDDDDDFVDNDDDGDEEFDDDN